MGEARRRWTSEEDDLLWELHQAQEKAPTGKCRKVNWNEIARQIPGRTNKDCRKRFHNRFTDGLRKGSWTPDEDARLAALVARYHYRWATIAQKMGTRNGDQCSKRWHHCLNPELERSPWTDEENQLLLSAVQTHGSSWKDIQRCHFPTRSANNIKNQYTILSRKGLDQIPQQPCCNPLFASISSSPTNPHATRRPDHDDYSYSSFSSTPHLHSRETPDMALDNLDFDPPMPSFHNGPSQQLPEYWITPWLRNGPVNLDPMVCDPAGMAYDLGVPVPQLQGDSRPFVVDEAGGFGRPMTGFPFNMPLHY